MEVTEFAVERATAVTDLILGLLVLFATLHIYRVGKDRDQNTCLSPKLFTKYYLEPQKVQFAP